MSMLKVIWFTGAILTLGCDTFAAPDRVPPRVVAMHVSAPTLTPLAGLFSGQNLEFKAGARFVKLSVGFQPAVAAATLQVQSCKGEFTDGVEVAFFPGLRRVYIEGGVTDFKANITGPEVESFAINFRQNTDVCIKTLHFRKANGVAVAIRSPEPSALPNDISAGATSRREKFLSAGLSEVLDQELAPRPEEDRWVFRFRGDGTFMIFGRSDETRTAGRFSAVGTYEIKDSEKNRVRLALSGTRLITAELWDGWLCGDLCASREPAKSAKVADLVEIEKLPAGGYMVRNRVRPRSRTLPFSDIRVRSTYLN